MDPRGIRNNNPGNLRSIGWDGEVGKDDQGFAVFDTAEAGQAALIRNLHAYNDKYGLDTPRGIINRWAPPLENNTSAYVTRVAGDLGIGADDKIDFNNPEQVARVAASIASHENGVPFSSAAFAAGVQAYQATSKLPKFSQTVARNAAKKDLPLDIDLSSDSTDAQFPAGTPIEDAAAVQSGAELADQTHRAGFEDAMADTVRYGTVTMGLVHAFQRAQGDPDFKLNDTHIQAMSDSRILDNERLSDYVRSANSQQDFTGRLAVAQQRLDYFQRAANTPGLSLDGMGLAAGQLIGGVSDPVAMIATMGLGASVNLVRGAYSARALSGVAEAAAGNIGIGATVSWLNNEKYGWHDMVEQGLAGAAFGALGHYILPAHVESGSREAALSDAAAGSLKDVHDNVNARAADQGALNLRDPLGAGEYGGVSTELHGMPESRVFARGAEEAEFATDRGSLAERLGYEPEPTIGGDLYRDLHDSGVIAELRSADDLKPASPFFNQYGGELPENAKAVYLPQDDKVYVFRDRLSDAEAADPSGLIAHEVGVHYGLERTLGTERYTELLAQVEKLAAKDERVAEALRHVPGDTESHLHAEEALGYLVEKHAALPAVQRLISTVRNWLRETVPLFRKLDITGNDVIQLVRGSVRAVRKEGRLSSDATFPYVYHGSPTKGIDQLDIAHAGTGEGNAAFGHGLYVTSEKGTALDYRNKESRRRGLDPRDGGLYRLRVMTTRDNLLRWDAPVEGQPVAAKLRGVLDVRDGETGQQVYERLARKLGSQQAASEALNEAGVHGIQYITGRTRDADVANSNYVLFSNEHLDVSARFSRGEPQAGVEQTPEEKVAELRMSTAAQKVRIAADAWDERGSTANEAMRARVKAWYEKRPAALKAAEAWIDSPGLVVQKSKSKVARFLGAHLFEDAPGIGKRENTVALDYERLNQGYLYGTIPTLKENLTKGMTPGEKAAYMVGGAQAAEHRIWTQVQEERLKHRVAIQSEQQWVSDAPEHIQTMAKALDDFFDRVTEDGRAAGDARADGIRGGGFVGHVPYQWQWDKISRAYNENPTEFNRFHKLIRDEYVAKVVDPALADLAAKGTATPDEIAALTARMTEKVDHLTSNYIGRVMSDPESRVQNADNHFATIAADLLRENWTGERITDAVANDFRSMLDEKVKDRSRTEFDLLRDNGGTRLLDYVNVDGDRMVRSNAHKFAGSTALARKGFNDNTRIEGALEAARIDGASPEELRALRFGFDAYSDRLKNNDRQAFSSLRNFTFAAMMGKLGFSVMADAAQVVSASGVGGFLRVFGKAFSKDTEFIKQLSEYAPSLLGQDHRLHGMTATGVDGRVIAGEGGIIQRVSQRASQMVGYMSGANTIGSMLHRGFIQVFAEDLVKTIREGGMSSARLADVGIDTPQLARIKAMLDTVEKDRAPGDRISWDKWDDQYAADTLIQAMHRGTWQVFQRALLGEAQMWLSESTAGKLFGQFRRYGLVSAEKQLVRNIAIGDTNTMQAFVLGTAWAAMLYYARLQANMLGKDEKSAKKYMDDNTRPWELTQGIATMMNMSGVLPDSIAVGQLLFGGISYGGQPGNPAASLGYLQSVGKAATAAGALATGQVDAGTRGQAARSILRIAPGANTLMGTYLSNELISKH